MTWDWIQLRKQVFLKAPKATSCWYLDLNSPPTDPSPKVLTTDSPKHLYVLRQGWVLQSCHWATLKSLTAIIKGASQNLCDARLWQKNDPFDLPQIKRGKMSSHSSLHLCTVISAQKQVWCSNHPLLSFVEKEVGRIMSYIAHNRPCGFHSSHVFTSKGMRTQYMLAHENIYTMFTLPRD